YSVLSELRASLQDPDNNLRSNAVFALANIEAKPANLLSEISSLALKDSDEQVRINALYALVKEEYKTFGSDLQTALKDPAPKVRKNAISTLGYIRASMISAETTTLAMPSLNSVLQEQQLGLNMSFHIGGAFISMGSYYGTEIGVEPKTAFLELISALQDPEPEVRNAALEGLTFSGSTAIAGMLYQTLPLSDSDPAGILYQNSPLSDSDTEVVISHFQTVLQTLRNTKNSFSNEEIESLNAVLQTLIKSKSKTRV
ncbi:MAG: HEAT repeat domain-containing protein, partial [Gloeotrichia echinulata HAB0833]